MSSDSDRPNAGGDGLTAAILPHHGVIARKVDTSFRDVDICAVATITSKNDLNKNDPGGFFAIRFWFGENGVSYWAVAFPGSGRAGSN